jgi:hypothetical protein
MFRISTGKAALPGYHAGLEAWDMTPLQLFASVGCRVLPRSQRLVKSDFLTP